MTVGGALLLLVVVAAAAVVMLHIRRARLCRIMDVILMVDQQKAARATAERAMANALLELDALRQQADDSGGSR
jgi:hypothetical protein